MSTHRSSFLLFFLLLLSPPPQANALPLGQWTTLISLSHSLMTRVANARAARGDLAGADRANKIADKLRLLGGGRQIWSVGWDFAWNAWRGGIPMAEISRAAAELVGALGEASRLSGEERAKWATRNYGRVIGLSNSLFRSLLQTFSRSGPLREAVLVLQREAAEGELLKDCLEVGARDLDGLVRIARDLFFSMDSGDREL